MYYLGLILATLLFYSCVPQQGVTGRNIASSQNPAPTTDTNPPSTPTFPSELNYLQYGQTQVNSTLNIQKTYTDTIYLRGQQIHTYVEQHKTQINCLALVFPTITATQGNNIELVATRPNSFFNLQTRAREYYYILTPSDELTNKTYCQKPQLLNYLAEHFPNMGIAYSLTHLAENTFSINAKSSPLELFDSNAQSITGINLLNLSINLSYEIQNQPPVGQSCTSSVECQQAGYDCCTNNQCVRDGELKTGVDTNSTEYLQALQDITNNPTHVRNYPQFFYYCPINVPPTPDPLPTPDPANNPDVRLATTKDLYDCTTPLYGNLSICTRRIENLTSTNLCNYLTDAHGVHHTDETCDAPVNNLYLVTSPYDLTFYNPTSSSNNFYYGTKPSKLVSSSIYQIIYGDQIIYDVNDDTTYSNISITSQNTNLYDTAAIQLNIPLPTSGTDNTLRIRYTTDGSCERVSNTLVKCFVEYVQGQNIGLPTDHYPGNQSFKIPYYANIAKYIQVLVDGNQKVLGADWTLDTSSKTISFLIPIEDGQKIKIYYHVTSADYPVFEDKRINLETIEQQCNCVGPGCSLEPSYTEDGSLNAFTCHYPPVDSIDPPMQMDVQVNTKAIPQKFFNTDGKEITSITAYSGIQEGTLFKYNDDEKIKPNNLDKYVGFNEIYGPISYTVDAAAPPTVVTVKKGRSYDIFTESGAFSTCRTCGSDYYSQLIKLFPDNFIYRGGGYFPDPVETSRSLTSTYRSDDLHFGRACFVPATMIPWTHKAVDDALVVQRRARQAAQHFLFANGYQRDWYGFDYGAIIGSFDGVTWFAIGNQRRVRALSNKLYIAVNSYFGDLTQTGNFKVSITDTSLTSGGTTDNSKDFYNDGAQCQQYHQCDTDQDCIAQLGWEYSCQIVTQITTSWPKFDENGKELINQAETRRLVDILVGGFAGPAKRCVYRGRGVPCTKNFNSVNSSNNYSGSTAPGLNACLPNNYCQEFSNGTPVKKFNNKIARFARAPSYQNSSPTLTVPPADTIGLEARTLGRPYDFNGQEAVPTEAQKGLNANHISAICIPGHQVTEDNYVTANQTTPTASGFQGDRIGGIGQTPTNYGGNNKGYYGYCSILDENGNYLLFNSTRTTDGKDSALAATQALSTNALKLFESIDPSLRLLADFKTKTIEDKKLDFNGCLRAPGSVCHTDLDCGPSPFVTQKLANIDPNKSDLLNSSERKFWKETLICSQAANKTSSEYDLKKNRCCRESGKELTIATSTNFSDNQDYQKVPGIELSLLNAQRQSRFMMLSYQRYAESGNLRSSEHYPILRCAPEATTADANNDINKLLYQFNTLNYIATNTCCSQHWIREFDEKENNGGHKWSPLRLQSFNYAGLKFLNWLPDPNTNNYLPFACNPDSAPDFTDCYVKSTTMTEAEKYFNYFGTLELLGVPQIAIHSPDYEDARPLVDNTQTAAPAAGDPIPYTVTKGAKTEYIDPATGYRSYASTYKDNFENNLKIVFSKDKITCCQPTGIQMPNDATPEDCCTGNLVNGRCCLPDYTDVSVYTNRFISSAAKGLDKLMFNESTGYVSDPNVVEQLAYQEGMCCSGSVIRGKVLATLRVPGLEDQEYNVQRFFDGTLSGDEKADTIKQFWEAGVRWNNHVYCAPTQPQSGN